MATILIETDLDVVNKYIELVEEITAECSLYINMKETLLDLLDSCYIKVPNKAKVIAETNF